jgi:hypothetical protein
MRAPRGVLHQTTGKVYVRPWHVDHPRLPRQSPAVRFAAEHRHDCWHFDLSPAAAPQLHPPDWIDPRTGEPTWLRFRIVDDRRARWSLE